MKSAKQTMLPRVQSPNSGQKINKNTQIDNTTITPVGVTLRKKFKPRLLEDSMRQQSLHENLENSNLSTSSTDTMNRSLPDLSIRLENLRESNYKEEIEELKQSIASAHKEIDNLLVENNDLKCIIGKITKQNDIYKQIYIDNMSMSTKKKNLFKKLIYDKVGKENESQTETPTRNEQDIHMKKGLPETANEDVKIYVNNKDESENSKHEKRDNHTEEGRTDTVNEGAKVNVKKATNEETTRNEEKLVKKTNETHHVKIDGKDKSSIFIFGGRQCTRLSSELKYKMNTQKFMKDYNTTSFIKPNAQSEEIGKTCDLFSIKEDDYVILSIGEHDNNPTKLLMNLGAILQKLEKPNVILLSISKSDYLNEKKLNDTLLLASKNHKNCTFLKIGQHYRETFLTRLDTMSKMISDTIAQNDYDTNYLKYNKRSIDLNFTSNNTQTCNKRSNNVANNNNKNTHTKPGTIPYYFSKEITSKTKYDVQKVKTQAKILNFFPVLSNTKQTTRITQEVSNNNFFRA